MILYVTNIYGEKLPVWTVDFETYFDTKNKYSLSAKGMTTVQYIRSPLFKAHGCSYVSPEGKSGWVTHADLNDFFSSIDWDQSAMLCHNTQFDGFIAYEIYGVSVNYYLDTLSMANGEFGPGVKNRLTDIVKRLKIDRDKISGELEKTDGIRDLSFEQEQALIPYAIRDSELTREAFEKFYFPLGFPEKELHIIDITLKTYVNPKLQIDAALCRAEIQEEDIRMKNLFESDLIKNAELSTTCKSKLEQEGLHSLLRSRECFAELLKSRGVNPPMKNRVSKTGEILDELTYAFAKNDVELISLGDDPRVSDLVAAWTGMKSTLRKTRAQRFLDVTDNGAKTLPIPLRYCGGRTHRWSGGGSDKDGGSNPWNPQNLNSGRDGRGSRLREAIIAPKGYRVVSIDSSQIECVDSTTMVLTKDRGYIAIPLLTTSDLIWDGLEWVSHSGVVFKGYKEVITYDGLTATPDHVVYLARGGKCSFIEAAMEGFKIKIGETFWQKIQRLFKLYNLLVKIKLNNKSFTRTLRPVYDIVNAGPRNRFTANGRIVSNCRVHAYIWDDKDLLETFVSGGDPYSKLATEVFKVPVSKTQNTHLRHVGKSAELGLGFGIGVNKFYNTVQTQYGVSADQFSFEDALCVVQYYREKRENIVKGWSQLTQYLSLMAAKALSGQSFKLFKFFNDKVIMPNELPIVYNNLHWQFDEKTKQGNYVYKFKEDWVKIYGAKMCIAKGTLVVTKRGNIPIEQIKKDDIIWDGESWVKTEGCIRKGFRSIIDCHGVYMTPDHLVLTEKGWVNATTANKYKRKTF